MHFSALKLVKPTPVVSLPRFSPEPQLVQDNSASSRCYSSDTPDHGRANSRRLEILRSPKWELSAELQPRITPLVEPGGPIAEVETIALEQSLWTRRCCTAGLCCSFLIALGAIGVGGFLLNLKNPPVPGFLVNTEAFIGLIGFPFAQYHGQLHYIPQHVGCALSPASVVLVPLLLNYGLAAIFDAMGYIHSVTLRWALWSKGKLRFNSNPRLFSAAANHVPNSWYMSVVSATALTFAYGSISQMTTEIDAFVAFDDNQQQPNSYRGPTAGIDWNGYAIAAAGICIFIQACISTFCFFYKSGIVHTWSPNPLMVSRACVAACAKGVSKKPSHSDFSHIDLKQRGIFASLTRSSASTSSSSRPEFGRLDAADTLGSSKSRVLIKPKVRQPSALAAVPGLRRVTLVIWTLCGFSTLLVAITTIIGIRTGSTKSTYIASLYGDTTLSPPTWSWYGRVAFRYVPAGHLNVHHRRELLGITIQSLFQSFLTLGLHYAEVVTTTIRDEQIWRQASRCRKGADTDPNWLLDNITNWPFLVLFVFKGVLQWLYGQTFTVNEYISVNLLPLITLTACMILFALFIEALVRFEPRGSQPATYGNIELLMKLMDDNKHKRFYWGDKGEVNGIRRAGTSGSALPELRRSRIYYGQTALREYRYSRSAV